MTDPPLGPAYHTIPSPPSDFTGRAAEIDDLLAHLSGGGALGGGEADGEAAVISGIRGIGGVGKTALALVVCARLAAAYPDAGLIFECQPDGERLPPEALLARVLHVFESTALLPETLPELQARYCGALTGRRGILLLDNAGDAAQVRPFLPPPPGWVVLVTSRARFPLAGARLRDLDVLGQDEAVALLRRMLGDGGRSDREDALLHELARRCGYLPLALRIAASHLTTYIDVSLPVYLAALAAAPLTSLKVEDESVQATLNLSYRALLRDAPALAAAWQELAVFPAPFDRPAAAAVLDVPEHEARSTLKELVARGLLEFDPASGRYDWHDLLRECALSAWGLESDLLPLWLRHANHYLALGHAADHTYELGGEGVSAGLATFDALRPHLDAAWIRLQEHEEVEALRWLSRYPWHTQNVHYLRMQARARIPLLDTALKAARDLKDDFAQAAHLRNLGLAYRNLGYARQAIGYHEQHLEIARALGDRRGEGQALGDLGLAHADLGDARQAIGYHEQHLEIARALGDRRGEANALRNLGTAHADLGDAERAIGYDEQHLAIVRALGDRRGEGHALGNLGLAYVDLSDARRAIGYQEQYLKIACALGDRRGEENALGGLGLAYADLGDARQAIGYHEQHLRIAREIGDRRGEGQALGDLGSVYSDLGHAPQAIGLLEQALAIAREIGARKREASAAWSLGLAYEKQGDYARAAGLMQILVDFQTEIGHRNAEKHAKRLEDVKRAVSGFSGTD